MDEKLLALNAIQKKLVGKRLSYKEIFAIMNQISKEELGDILTTYFAASGYSKGFTNKELFYLTKAMVETGEKLHFDGIVADKHSIGGVPGTRTTPIVVAIIAAAGYKIPKSSSRAITSPDGTADDHIQVIRSVAGFFQACLRRRYGDCVRILRIGPPPPVLYAGEGLQIENRFGLHPIDQLLR